MRRNPTLPSSDFEPQLSPDAPRELVDLAMQCRYRNPRQRPSAHDLVEITQRLLLSVNNSARDEHRPPLLPLPALAQIQDIRALFRD